MLNNEIIEIPDEKKNWINRENCRLCESTQLQIFFKLEPRLHSYLKSFLVYLEFNISAIPETQYKILNTDPRVDRKLNNPSA